MSGQGKASVVRELESACLIDHMGASHVLTDVGLLSEQWPLPAQNRAVPSQAGGKRQQAARVLCE